MSTPAERVADYLRQFDRLRDTGGTIHNVHTDPDAEQVTLTSADLHALLAAAQQPAVLGYALAARDGAIVAEPAPTDDLAAAEHLRDRWTRDLPEGLDWDYRVVAITELPTEES